VTLIGAPSEGPHHHPLTALASSNRSRASSPLNPSNMQPSFLRLPQVSNNRLARSANLSCCIHATHCGEVTECIDSCQKCHTRMLGAVEYRVGGRSKSLLQVKSD
jgi:hypothetical protein